MPKEDFDRLSACKKYVLKTDTYSIGKQSENLGESDHDLHFQQNDLE